jgi:non-homologous end joining protein Ku
MLSQEAKEYRDAVREALLAQVENKVAHRAVVPLEDRRQAAAILLQDIQAEDFK